MVELQQPEQPAPVPVAGDLLVVVMDGCHFPTPPKRAGELTVSKTTTVEELRVKMATLCGYSKDDFSARYSKHDLEPEDIRTLGELELPPKFVIHLSKPSGSKADFSSKSAVSNIINNEHAPIISAPSYSSSAYSSSSTSPSGSSNALVTYGPATASSSNYSYSSSSSSSYGGSYSSSSSYSWNQPSGKSSTGYIGLSNQGATCYMNSLIQSLFMTPEFRNALYNWSFDEKYRRDIEKAHNGKEKSENGVATPPPTSPTPGSPTPDGGSNGNGKAPLSAEEREKKEKTSIPLQLQRLFARLQLCDVQAVKTKDLTKSFGWEDVDAFTQHDVQELCRVLFDALEKNFQGTKQANLVNELYQGKMRDYVKCKECGHESARVDEYLDIPLVIRGFGETVPVKSVEEALHKFVQPETLDGDNQYNCEKCNKKVDAVKGLRFEKFPYLLTLQLKRFDFDFQTLRRIKLNDRVTFPLYLDLNSFLKEQPVAPKHQKEEKEAEEEEEEEDDSELDEEEDEGTGPRAGRSRHYPEEQGDKRDYMLVDNDHDDGPHSHKRERESRDSGYNHEPDFDAAPPVVTADAPYVYELFSVMIHRGSSMGGHYYAYIKSFDNGKWYDFNDSMVSEITLSDVKKAFGGDEEGGYSSMPRSIYSSYRSNANAYMLMYRQMDPNRNTKPMSTTEIPEELRRTVEDENGAAKQKKKAEELEREMVKLKIFYNGVDKPLSMHKTATLNDTAKAAINLFGLSDRYTAGNYRLRNYSHYNELPGDTYTGKEQKTLDDLNFYYGHSYSGKTLLLETKDPNEEFDEYDSSQMLFRVAKYNPATRDFEQTVNVYVNKNGSVGDLREAIEKKLSVPATNMNIYKEASYSTWNNPPASILNKPDGTELRLLHFLEPEKLYVEYAEQSVATPTGDDEDGEIERDDSDEKEEDEQESPVIQALERIKNIIEVKFNLPGKEDADQKITVDKTITLKEFKDRIQPIVGLPAEDFKIKRGSAPHLYELINESDTLNDSSIRDGMSLTIEKGRPLKEGETNYMFEFFDLTKDTDHFKELFEIPVHEDMLVADLKKEIAPKLIEAGIPVPDPAFIRLRDVTTSQYSRRVGKAFPDAVTVKKATLYVYSKRVAVQIMDGAETVQNADKDLVIFVQRFSPSKFELSRKEDFVVNEDTSLDEFRELLGAKFGIPAANVGVVRVDHYGFYDDPDLLDVPELHWDKPVVTYSTKNTVGDTLMMRNGNLVLVRDNTEQLKELSKEEKEAIKKEQNKRKSSQSSSSNNYSSYWNRKEKALKIHTVE